MLMQTQTHCHSYAHTYLSLSCVFEHMHRITCMQTLMGTHVHACKHSWAHIHACKDTQHEAPKSKEITITRGSLGSAQHTAQESGETWGRDVALFTSHRVDLSKPLSTVSLGSSHVAQGVPKPDYELLAFPLFLLNAGLTGMHRHTQFMQCWRSDPGFCTCQASIQPNELHPEPRPLNPPRLHFLIC